MKIRVKRFSVFLAILFLFSGCAETETEQKITNISSVVSDWKEQSEPSYTPPVSSASEQAASSEAQSVIVYITNSGTKYHRDGCQYLWDSKIPRELDKLLKKYTPCSVCKPPEKKADKAD